MELKEAIQLLKSHNEWRREEREQIGQGLKMTDPKKLGIAIDTVVSEFENLFISGVVFNEAEKEFKPCGEGDNVFKCKDASECGYSLALGKPYPNR